MGEGADHDRRRVRAPAVGVRSPSSSRVRQGDGAEYRWSQTSSSCAGRWPRAPRPVVAPRPTRGSAPWSCATARSSARAPRSRPAAPHAEVEALARRRRPRPRRHRVHHARAVLPPGPHRTVRRARWPRPGVTRVVVALEDPDPQVAGRGIAQLRDRGHHRRRRRRGRRPPLARSRRTSCTAAWAGPTCVVKTAMSLDGRIAARDGSLAVDHRRRGPGRRPRAARPTRRPSSSAPAPRWPTGRASPCATSSRPSGRQPLRVLLDATGRVPADGPLFDADARAHARRHHRRRARRRRSEAWLGGRRQGAHGAARRERRRRRPRRRARACSAGRRAPGDGRGRRRAAAGRWSRPGSSTASSPTSAPRLLGRDGRPALDLAGPARIADAAPLAAGRRARRRSATDVRLDYEPAAARPGEARPDVHRHRRGARHRAVRVTPNAGGARIEIDADGRARRRRARRVDRGERLLPHGRRARRRRLGRRRASPRPSTAPRSARSRAGDR